MIRYVFREEGPVIVKGRAKADPQKIGEEIEQARQVTAEGGDLRATMIDRARNARNYLHRFFEWDDARAAHQHRLAQANLLICSLRVEMPDGEQQPAFISVTPGKDAKRFSTPDEIVGSVGLQLAVLEAARRDLDQFRKRYSMLGEICAVITEAQAKAAEMRERLEGQRTAAA